MPASHTHGKGRVVWVSGGAVGASSIDFYGYNQDITMIYHDVW